jgi:hypothetical protein
MKINVRYLPKILTRKDKKKQYKELKKSRNMYKKGIYYTRRKIKSFPNKKSHKKRGGKGVSFSPETYP